MQKPDFLKGRKGITFVDLFAGAGGFSEGFMQAYTDKNYYDFCIILLRFKKLMVKVNIVFLNFLQLACRNQSVYKQMC